MLCCLPLHCFPRSVSSAHPTLPWGGIYVPARVARGSSVYSAGGVRVGSRRTVRAVRAVLPMSMVERGILERREGSERARVERSGATPVAAAKHRLRWCASAGDVSRRGWAFYLMSDP